MPGLPLSHMGGDSFAPRETREGWPLLTVETEVKGASKKTNERGPFLAGSLDLSCWHKRFCSALAALVDLVQNIFSSLYTISIPLSPSGQAAVLGRLFLSVCLWWHLMALFTLSCYYAKQLLVYDSV